MYSRWLAEIHINHDMCNRVCLFWLWDYTEQYFTFFGILSGQITEVLPLAICQNGKHKQEREEGRKHTLFIHWEKRITSWGKKKKYIPPMPQETGEHRSTLGLRQVLSKDFKLSRFSCGTARKLQQSSVQPEAGSDVTVGYQRPLVTVS